MADNKNPDEKQPGENPEGTFHFNPGNMAGKKPGDAEQTSENRDEPPTGRKDDDMGQGIIRDERGQEQPADKTRAQQVNSVEDETAASKPSRKNS